jgi:hypothetical protein
VGAHNERREPLLRASVLKLYVPGCIWQQRAGGPSIPSWYRRRLRRRGIRAASAPNERSLRMPCKEGQRATARITTVVERKVRFRENKMSPPASRQRTPRLNLFLPVFGNYFHNPISLLSITIRPFSNYFRRQFPHLLPCRRCW